MKLSSRTERGTDDIELLERMIRPLCSWFADQARDLPWRRTRDPYCIWVSEIMLQQTRVEAVKPYYSRFISELPDVRALAACPEDTLLKLWEGLGYYSRVRNMQKAAAVIVQQYDGVFPQDEKLLLKLPGIGPYTAGAVASIAFGRAVPAVDGNVLRVISRLTGSSEDILLDSTKKHITGLLEAVIGSTDPGILNQAMMELGALICLPGENCSCSLCPLQDLCVSRRLGITDRIPVRNVKTKRKMERRTILVISDGIHGALRKRPEKGLLAGLYELPGLEGERTEEEVLSYIRSLQLEPVRISKLPDAKHVFSHVTWIMSGYMVLVEELKEKSGNGLIIFETAGGETGFAIPAAFEAYAKYLNIKKGREALLAASGPSEVG